MGQAGRTRSCKAYKIGIVEVKLTRDEQWELVTLALNIEALERLKFQEQKQIVAKIREMRPELVGVNFSIDFKYALKWEDGEGVVISVKQETPVV